MANHFLLGYIKTCFSSFYKSKKREVHQTHIGNIFAIFLYSQQRDDSACRKSLDLCFCNNNSLLIRILFTCNISLQKIHLFTFTVIFLHNDNQIQHLRLKPMLFIHFVFAFYLHASKQGNVYNVKMNNWSQKTNFY